MFILLLKIFWGMFTILAYVCMFIIFIAMFSEFSRDIKKRRNKR